VRRTVGHNKRSALRRKNNGDGHTGFCKVHLALMPEGGAMRFAYCALRASSGTKSRKRGVVVEPFGLPTPGLGPPLAIERIEK
jgi:hypothetical protein